MDVIKGSDLKLLLKKRGITSNYLSDVLGIHKTSISRYFTDDIAMPATFILKVAALSGLEMRDLIKMDKGETPSIAMEPAIAYKKTPKESLKLDLTIDGVSLTEYVAIMSKRLSDMEEKLLEMEKKNKKVMELEAV